jgi:tripartite-type tricarboxylate transporter receptor subunit TctC
MKLPRRNFLHLAAGAAALPAVSRIARAQAYPTRPVHIVVGFPAGGALDIVARLMGEWLSQRLGQPFVIENRPGAATNIATETVVKARPDGYTILMASTTNTINATLYDKLSFNFIRDIVPIAMISSLPLVIVVNPSVPAKSVPEFIAYAKANPGKLSMASAGTGVAGHIAGELFKMMTGINMLHVPYRGGGPALTDLMGGQVQVYFSPLPESISPIKGGKGACGGGDHGGALGRIAGRPDRRRVRAGLRGERLVRRRRTEVHIRRDRRQAQQGDQRGPRRSQN